jgi:hypothetical protein
VDIAGVQLSYVESCYFAADDGDPMINVVFMGRLPDTEAPHAASAEEVADLRWMTIEEALADPRCPPWTRRALGRAERLRER